jgi:hypothetical protein
VKRSNRWTRAQAIAPRLPVRLATTPDLLRARRLSRERVAEGSLSPEALLRLAEDRRRDVGTVLRRRQGGLLSSPEARRLLDGLGPEPSLRELTAARRALLRSAPLEAGHD